MDGRLSDFNYLADKLDECQKGLSDYLETKRMAKDQQRCHGAPLAMNRLFSLLVFAHGVCPVLLHL